MRGVATLCVVAVVVGSAVVASAAIPEDAGRTWKTIPEAYRLGFAAGGADMLDVLNSHLLYWPGLDVAADFRSMVGCVNRMSTLIVLRDAVEKRMIEYRLPVPHEHRDAPVVAWHVDQILGPPCVLDMPGSQGSPAGIPEREAAYRVAGRLKIGKIGRRTRLAYVTHDEYRAATKTFRNGYVAGAANMLRQTASLLREEPPHKVQQKLFQTGSCVASKYDTLDTLHRRLDAEVDKDAASGHSYTIASTLYVLLVDCP